MRPVRPCLASGVILLVSVLMITGCGWSMRSVRSGPPSADTDPITERLVPEIEALYLAWNELDQVYKDIKSLEKGFLFDRDDRQLGAVQKASLYVQDASVRIHHQWERLSILHYIHPPMKRDYMMLCVKGLTADMDEIGYDRMFLRIYAPVITHETITADLERAIRAIDANVTLIQRILDILQPIVGAPAHAA